MAFFDAHELGDCVTHEAGLEDDTGLCAQVLPRPTRRLKNMCVSNRSEAFMGASSEDEDQQLYSPNFSPDLSDSATSQTFQLIQDRLLAKVQEAEQARTFQCAHQLPSTSGCSSDLFVPKVLDSKTGSVGSSMVARLLAQVQVSNQPKEIVYAEYAKYEAMEENSAGSKLITIVYPFSKTENEDGKDAIQQNGFSKHRSNNKRCAIAIRVLNKAKISDLIGLSCHVYTRMGKIPACEHPSNYSLYLAEDNFDYDTELPPQDRHRLVVDCGFPVLAMVKNSEVLDYHQREHHSVKVYLVTGKCFTYELESLDVPLKWLFKQAMTSKGSMEKQEGGNQGRHAHLLRVLEYALEPLDLSRQDSSQPLNLENTISSAGTTDFLLLRKNSSRGNFQQHTYKHGVLFREDSEFGDTFFCNSLSGSKPATPGIASSSGRFDYQLDSPDESVNVHSPVNTLVHKDYLGQMVVGLGPVIEEYLVDRLHRIKPKWLAKLYVREDCLEVSPVQQPLQPLKKKSFGNQKSGQKLSRILWDFVCAVESQVLSNKSRRLVRIVWLSVPELFQSLFLLHCQRSTDTRLTPVLSSSSMEMSRLPSTITAPSDARGVVHWQMAQAYDLSSWKILQLEANEEEAYRIVLRITEILESRNSQARFVYLHSFSGAKKPAIAFEAVYGLALACPLEQPSLLDALETAKLKSSPNEGSQSKNFHQSSSSTMRKENKGNRKVSVKSSAGAVLSRMLSRQD